MSAVDNKLKECQYGEKCYRKNPIHFGEYSHRHLDTIYKKGKSPTTNEYIIPDNFSMSADIIAMQLEILEKLYPEANQQQESKSEKMNFKLKVDDKQMKSLSKTVMTSKQATIVSNSKRDSNVNLTIQTELPSTSNSNSKLAKKSKIEKNIKDFIAVVLEKGQMAEKLKKAAPYNMFLTAVTDSKLSHNEPLTVTMQEILDKSLGEIESSVQINFMIDIGWLLGQYYFAEILSKPLLVLYGDDLPEISTISQHKPNVTAIRVRMSSPFATSHTKMMLFAYKDNSMRVVISTANLYEDDWHNRTQGIWISPNLPALTKGAVAMSGESRTNFRQDLISYLSIYKISQLDEWISRIRNSDFSAINVFLIGSVPGGFCNNAWGHARLGSLLQKYSAVIDEKIPIICQSSSIGSLGPDIDAWIKREFLNSLRKNQQTIGLRQIPPFKMIYPSFNNVKKSHDELLGGGCLPYGKTVNSKQPWLKQYLYQWRSNARNRSQAMPHIKSYTRLNMEEQSMYWFVLTSANLSKAAWGAFNKTVKVEPILRISNYEVGVLFLPEFVNGKKTFPLGKSHDGVPAFPIPYDIPLTPYEANDRPFLMDDLH